MEQIGNTMEKFSASRAAASSYQKGSLNPADKQLAANSEDIRSQLQQLPFSINASFEYAVVGHVQYFGWDKVLGWAQKAKDKREPERWFMTVLRRERYGK